MHRAGRVKFKVGNRHLGIKCTGLDLKVYSQDLQFHKTKCICRKWTVG